MLWCGLLIATGMRIGFCGDVVICIDMDFGTSFNGLGGWARRRSTSSIDGSDSLCNVYHFRDLALSILEILNGDDRILTLVVVVVCKRVVQLVVGVSNGASAEED